VVNMLMSTEAFGKLDSDRATSADLAQPAYAGLRRPWDKGVMTGSLPTIYAAIEYIRNLEGDKHVVLLTPGGLIMNAGTLNLPPSLYLHHKDDEARLVARANDARVALDIIYTARAGIPPVDITGIVTNIRLNEVALTDLEANDIKLEATAARVPPTGQATQVRVELKIDASRLTLTRKGVRREGLITLWILCGDAKQQVVGTLKQEMTLSLDDAFYQRAMTSGIPYTATVPITGAATIVKVLVYDYGADLLGTAVVRLK
jgi:hypothetical protein